VRIFLASLLTALVVAGSVLAAETIEHVVARGDTLWSIAAQTDIYADPYLWPVIYRFNRDQIVDPARIYPDQTLLIPIDLDEQAKTQARAEAGAP
jgi:nucleoid-associated protein YgaU